MTTTNAQGQKAAMNQATEEFEYDIRTYTDDAGIERWADDNTPVNQNTAFRCAFGGEKIDVAKMAANAKTGRAAAERMTAGAGKSQFYGMSRKADKRLAMNQVNAHSKAVPGENWASMSRKV